MIIGWMGLGLLIISYLTLTSKYYKWFIPLDTIASFLLTIYAILIKDIPFIVVNGFITSMLIIKYIKGGI